MDEDRLSRRAHFFANAKWLCSPCFVTNMGAFGAVSKALVAGTEASGSFSQRYSSVFLASVHASMRMPCWEMARRTYGGNMLSDFGCAVFSDLFVRTALLAATLLFQEKTEGARATTRKGWLISTLKHSLQSGVRLTAFVTLVPFEEVATWWSPAKWFVVAAASGALGSLVETSSSQILLSNVARKSVSFGLFMTLYESAKLFYSIPTISMLRKNSVDM
jgi:hypothetical protein